MKRISLDHLIIYVGNNEHVDQVIEGLYQAQQNSSGAESELYKTMIKFFQTNDDKYIKRAKSYIDHSDHLNKLVSMEYNL